MLYKIEHVTRYAYSRPVGLSFQVAHLRPRDDAEQTCLSSKLVVVPAPERIDTDLDYFGNDLARFELVSPHQKLIITATSEVDVRRKPEIPDSSEPWEDVRQYFAETRWGQDADSAAAEFLFPSPLVPYAPALRDYARASFTPEAEIVAAALDLMTRIHEEFEFDPTATHVTTSVETVLAIRRGVCQDFAHLMIGCLRALGLPARYVSGYLLTQPPPGQPRLIGADASHAWVALYVPGYGWLALDPTNNMVPGDKHIMLAWGRDFGDVSPLRGVILGGGEHEVDVGVTVTPLDEEIEPASGLETSTEIDEDTAQASVPDETTRDEATPGA
ncbi:transglutaminase family protein [Uliginosibacterium sp. H3]|uniref:Transglutaminase family protein n=1 Tax=Uliginosibacterium silvisoli TaxID=3114758 RepID=A0ABU6K304_9RHOO|nr:transglutaminase family protein [Uliginosibacterium sp. H3]